jgi:restriction endonuclease S subunit
MTNPAGWKTQRLDAIASTQLGKMLNKSKQTGKNTVPYLRSFNVQWGHFDMSDVNEMDIEPFEREKFSIRYGDLLVCEGGESGRVALWNQDYEIAFQNALHRVRAGNSISNKYLYYYFEWLVKNNLIDHLFNGVTIKHFPQGNLRSVQVSFPEDLKEQERIVEILEDHLSRLDAALADVKQAKLKAVSFRNSVLHEVFSGFLSIEKWEGFEVKNLGKWVTGSTPKSSNPANQGNKVPFLTPGDVSAYGKIELVERSISAIGADSVRRVTPPSVNLVCIGATLGKVGWTDKEIV